MDNIKEQILSYPQLPPEAQKEVDAYVEHHPEWASLLRDVRHIESLLHDSPVSCSALTAYVVAQRMGMEEPSPPLREEFARLEQVLETDDELQARADEIRDRLDAAETALDPVSHFESLTGHSLSSGPISPSSEQSTRHDRTPNAPSDHTVLTRLIDEFLTPPFLVRGAGTLFIVLLTGYLTLFAVDRVTRSPLEELAAVEISDQMVESYYSSQTRGASPTADTTTVDDLYLRSLSTLRNAESSTLGLFPRYNLDSLRRAEKGLNRVLSRTEPHSFLSLEARFYLGKACLARDRPDKARSHFQAIVNHDGRRASEARRILSELEALDRNPGSNTAS